ncbi:hydrolase of the alpha/beta superfamily [Mortierella sp. GBAus27b]|nr:hydrolase of the alpha/beta superfamily [Mortierella sp. GBAus27b]
MARSDVTFLSGPFKLAGHLYTPENTPASTKLPAIVTVHPFTGVKEQTSGVYAQQLSEQLGFVALAFDRRYQGLSEGEPRQLEDAHGMVEDVKAAVTYLSTLDNVDPARIGVLGICAGGGYALAAASMDPRVKAVATVSGVDLGGFIRSLGKEKLQGIIAEGAQARIEYARTGAVKYLPVLPTKEEITKDTPPLMAEGSDYYLTPRGQFKTQINRTAIWSYDSMAQYDSFTYLDWISPRPVLLIAGSKADTLPFSEEAYKKALEPKELYLVEGRTHIDLYDRAIPEALPKLKEFFSQKL